MFFKPFPHPTNILGKAKISPFIQIQSWILFFFFQLLIQLVDMV